MVRPVVIVAFLVGYWAVNSYLRSRKASTTGSNSEAPKTNQGKKAPNDAATEASAIKDIWHEVLGVPKDAPYDEIVKAYRIRISLYHPDRVSRLAPDIVALAERESQRINMSFEYAQKLRRGY